MKALTLVAGLLLLAGPAVAQDDPLADGNKAFRKWIDKPVTFGGTDGSSSRMMFAADGNIVQPGGVGDIGTWRHHEMGFCASWKQTADGREKCYSIGTTSGQTYVTLQGADGPTWYAKP
jgi:hypothetical protein